MPSSEAEARLRGAMPSSEAEARLRGAMPSSEAGVSTARCPALERDGGLLEGCGDDGSVGL
jgi:hypothetical protein